MGQKNRAEVNINGKLHVFVGAEDVEYIQKVADYLNDKLVSLSSTDQGKRMSTEKLHIITEMNIVDEYFKALEAHKGELLELRKKLDNPLAEQQKNRISELTKETDMLREKISQLQYELSFVQETYESLKKENEQLLEQLTQPDDSINEEKNE